MSDHPCPRCEGRGWYGPVHINRGDKPHEWCDRVECDFCDGTSKIDADHHQAWTIGQAFRGARCAREESLREAAARLGLRASELSALELGRGGMAAWHHPFATSAYLEARHALTIVKREIET
jgi:hypothetical protein